MTRRIGQDETSVLPVEEEHGATGTAGGGQGGIDLGMGEIIGASVVISSDRLTELVGLRDPHGREEMADVFAAAEISKIVGHGEEPRLEGMQPVIQGEPSWPASGPIQETYWSNLSDGRRSAADRNVFHSTAPP